VATIRYIGSYFVPVREEERQAALACHGTAEFAAAELQSLALVELEVLEASRDFDIAQVKQPHTPYVPYDESYFDPVSLEELPHEPFKSPTASSFRIAFFLHFFDPNQPLMTPYGDVKVAARMDRPSHLEGKQYVYWD
jgi:hypothetical protein